MPVRNAAILEEITDSAGKTGAAAHQALGCEQPVPALRYQVAAMAGRANSRAFDRFHMALHDGRPEWPPVARFSESHETMRD